MKLLFLGTGTSHGVPVIGCDCQVCKSTDPKNKRFRSSAYVTAEDGKQILIDCGPEFRMQCLAHNIKNVDCVLLTHSHADHLHGLDDLRIFSSSFWRTPTNEKALEQYNRPPVPIYTNQNTKTDVENRFDYIFRPVKQGGGVAKITLETPEDTFSFGTTKITPVPMFHGTLPVVGWLLTQTFADGTDHSIAYLTDVSRFPDESTKLVNQKAGTLEHLVIDGLRIKEHSTHFTVLEALQCAEKLNPKNVWLTHLTHLHSHQEIQDYINQQLPSLPGLKNCLHVCPAYDGQEIQL